MIIKIWDAINDPLIGWMSDHTQSRWGPRLPWSVGLSVPLVAVYAALWYYKINSTVRRIVGVIGAPILGFVSFYTGLLLSGAMFV